MYKRYHCNQIYVISQSDSLVKWQHGLHCYTIGHGQLQSIEQSILTNNLDRVSFATLAIFSTIINVDRSSRPVELGKSVVRVRHCTRVVLYILWKLHDKILFILAVWLIPFILFQSSYSLHCNTLLINFSSIHALSFIKAIYHVPLCWVFKSHFTYIRTYS